MTNPLEKAELLEHKLRLGWPKKSRFFNPSPEQESKIATSRALLASMEKQLKRMRKYMCDIGTLGAP